MSLNIKERPKRLIKTWIIFITHLLVIQPTFNEQIQQIADNVQKNTKYNFYGIDSSIL